MIRPKQINSKLTTYTVSSQPDQCHSHHHKDTLKCHELSFYIQNANKYFTSNTEFQFLSGTHTLDNTQVPVDISGISSITFTGLQYSNDTWPPIIQCINGSSGFIFRDSSDISLSSLVIEGCGRTIHDTALSVTDCNSLTLSDFAIRNTTGVGLMIRNVSTLGIVHCNFSNNGLGVSNCSLETYKWWYSVNVITTDIHEDVNYTIADTIFSGSIANGGQLGGGLHIHIIDAQSANITLNNNIFREIYGCLSAGANITVEEYHGVAMITVNGSEFIDNYRTDIPNYLTHLELIGGALKIKTQLNDIMASQVEHHNDTTTYSNITINSTSFINNEARFCAAAGIEIRNSVRRRGYIQVMNSMFEGNKILLLNQSDCSGRVGGLCIFPVSDPYNTNLTVVVANSTFVNNTGRDGAALLIWSVVANSHVVVDLNVIVNNSRFYSNNAAPINFCEPKSTITFRSDFNNATQGNVSITFDNCNLTENKYGYALMVDQITDVIVYQMVNLPSTYIDTFHLINVTLKINRCVFRANTMGLGIFKGPGTLYNISIQSSNFTENGILRDEEPLGTVAVVGFSYSTIVNIADIYMSNNSLTPIYTDNCGLWFHGHNVIENNTAFEGGGIHISGIGYALMAPNTTLIFRNNNATRGGALFSPQTQVSSSFRYYSPCTFLSLKTAQFYNNSAVIAGHNMYGGTISGCVFLNDSDNSQISAQDIYANCSYYLVSANRDTSLFNPPSSTDVSSDPFRVLQCNDTHVLIDHSSISRKLYPGQSISFKLTTTGYCYGFSPGFLNISAQEATIMEDDIQGQKIDSSCSSFSFKPLLNKTNTMVKIKIDVAHSILAQTFPLEVNVTVLPCPHGMVLDDNNGCQCEKAIKNYVKLCNISNVHKLFTKTAHMNNWLAYNNCINIAPTCPFDYCSLKKNISFNLDDNTTNLQCNHNRTGKLCGRCQLGHSLMLGSNKCEPHCSNYYLLLLIVFIVAGVLLVFFIIFLNLTVSMGILNGLLFYANIIKLNETQLFPNGRLPVITQFISWLNLDFGIESCFFDGLNGYWKTWLQFVFPLYVWLVMISIILYSNKSIKFSQYLPTNIIPVLATLILISFTKLLRTITDVFMATTLECGHHTEVVWSIDGNIEYWGIEHIVLMGFAVIILIFVAIYTFLLLFSQCLQRADNNGICCCFHHIFLKIRPFTDAYAGPFTQGYGYWVGVLILVRIIMTSVFMYTSGSADRINNYVIVAVEVIIIGTFHSGFYQSKRNYYCEKFFHFNLCAVCLINTLYYGTPHAVTIATAISVTLSLLVFIGIICLYTYKAMLRCGRCGRKKGQPLLNQDDEDKNINADKSSGVFSASLSVRQRDSIIFDS